jgi:hypothetical protein
MAAGKLDFLIEQGATFKRTITLKDEDGVALNISGWTFEGQIRKKYDSPSILAPFTCTNIGSGQFTIELSHAITAALPVTPASDNARSLTSYSYDIEATKADSTKDRILEGKVNVSPEVTK